MASLAGVIEPEASLLDGAEVPAEVKPLAACAYEKAGAGAEAVADAFSVAEVILLIQKLKSFELEEIFEASRAVADEIVYGFWRRAPGGLHLTTPSKVAKRRAIGLIETIWGIAVEKCRVRRRCHRNSWSVCSRR